MPPIKGTASRSLNTKEEKMAGKFEIYKDKSGKYRWRLTHTSGMVIAKSGESYPTKVHAIKTIWSALANTNGR